MFFAAILLALVLLALIVGLVTVLVVRRLVMAREERRVDALVQELRPMIVAWLADPEGPPPLARIDSDDRRRRNVLAGLLARYGTMIRGDTQRRLIEYVATEGFVDSAIADLYTHRPAHRGRAARALGDFGSARAVRHLSLTVVNDPDPAVRLAATRALGRIDDYKSAAALLMVLPTLRVPTGVVAQSLLDMGLHAFRALVSACDDEEVEVRRVACRIVGLIGAGMSPDGVAAARRVLRERATDGDAQVRAFAIRSLAHLGDIHSTSVFYAALDDPDPQVRLAASQAAHQLIVRELAPNLLDAIVAELRRAVPAWEVVRSAAHGWAALADELDSTAIRDETIRAAALPFLKEGAHRAYRSLAQ